MAPLTNAEFSNRAFALFIVLQALDVVTTMIGLRLGAAESNAFIAQLMRMGPLPGLLFSKLLCLALMIAAVIFGRGRVMRLLNPWSAAVVAWNVVAIVRQVQAGA